MTISCSVKRVRSTRGAPEVAYQRTFRGLKQGLKESGDLLLAESQKIVPLDKGPLMRSGRCYMVGRGYATIQVIVEYVMPYAVFQHENLYYKHLPGRTAKFLERPARRLQARFARITRERSEKK
jgi:hypothetical protein